MAPKFGTSGLRGLVAELTDNVLVDYTRAFLATCPTGGAVHIGRDLRPSSPHIAQTVMAAIEAEGVQVVDAGALPTPALALQSMQAGHGAIMITGSHIPADRNDQSDFDQPVLQTRRCRATDAGIDPCPGLR